MSDTVKVFGKTWNDVTGFKAKSGQTLLPYIRPNGSVNITENGTVDVTDKASAVVNVQPSLQSKTVTPSKSAQIIAADSSQWGIVATIADELVAGVECPWGKTLEDGTYNIVGDFGDQETEFDEDFTIENGSGSLVINGDTFACTSTGITSSYGTGFYATLSGQVPTGYDGLSLVTVQAIPAQYITTSDADATAADILSGKTAYVNGVKLTGSLVPSSAGGLKCEHGTFTLETDWTAGSSSVKSIPHTLGVIPDVIIITPDAPTEDGDPVHGYIWLNKPIGEAGQFLTSSAETSYPAFAVFNVYAWGPPLKSRIYIPTSSSYMINGSSKMPTASDFKLFRLTSSTTWRAGTYNYFVSEKWW